MMPLAVVAVGATYTCICTDGVALGGIAGFNLRYQWLEECAGQIQDDNGTGAHEPT